jgi:hypothetical protein
MPRIIAALGWANAGLHLVGLGLAAAYIRAGSPLVPLAERRHYLTAAPAGWMLAWAVWAGCAVSMFAFTVAVGRRVNHPLTRWAAGSAAAAVAVDLTCDSLFLFHIPRLAAAAPTAAFVRTERWTNFFSLTVANGLYSVSTLLLTLALRRRPGIATCTVPIGVAVFFSGMFLAAAGVTAVPELAVWATGPTIGLYCVWVMLVARAPAMSGDAT